MYDFVVYLLEEGVLGLAQEISDGVLCDFFIDGVQYAQTFTPDEYIIKLNI